MNVAEHRHQPLPTKLLNAMANGEVDSQAIAAQLMVGLELDQEIKWVGFAKTAEVWA